MGHRHYCALRAVKLLVKTGSVGATMSALSGAEAMGFDFDGMLEVVMALSKTDFYKSMTTHADHRVWQDV